MLTNVQKYCELIITLKKLREKKFDHVEEDHILEELDEIWLRLNLNEIAQIEEFCREKMAF